MKTLALEFTRKSQRGKTEREQLAQSSAQVEAQAYLESLKARLKAKVIVAKPDETQSQQAL